MLALPTTPALLVREVIVPEFAGFASTLRDPYAVREMIAIAVQETGLATRQQDHGPAHSLWQFELSGVHGVLVHPRTWAIARHVCARHGLAPRAEEVHAALLTDDGLAAAFARLNLWADPTPLPCTEEQGWETYLRVWRPGAKGREAFDRARWSEAWAQADAAYGVAA